MDDLAMHDAYEPHFLRNRKWVSGGHRRLLKIREWFSGGHIVVNYKNTRDNHADLFTKPRRLRSPRGRPQGEQTRSLPLSMPLAGGG